MSQNKHRIVIIGSGFAGVKAALELCEDPRFHVTLISTTTDFRIYGALYKTATGGTRKISSIALSHIFKDKPVHILHDKATKIDRQKKIIHTEINHTLHYDAAIIAVGVVTNYFNIKGLKEYSYGIKSLEEAEELKQHLHAQIAADHKPDLNYVVVGGGPTGVELAGVLPSYIREIAKHHGLGDRKIHVDLVEAAPRILPRMPKDISRTVTNQLKKQGIKVYTKTCVQAQTVDALMVNNKPIRSHTVIWTAGMSNNPFFDENNFQISSTRKVRVDQFLQAEPGIYVLGDNADTPYSGMAQTALYDGHFVAKNMIRMADNKDPKPYKAKKPIYVMPAGPHWAAVLWGNIRIYGRSGWWLRRLADLIAYHDYEPFRSALPRFLAEEEHEETCPVCIDNNSKKINA